jgi:hypothetical protein
MSNPLLPREGGKSHRGFDVARASRLLLMLLLLLQKHQLVLLRSSS